MVASLNSFHSYFNDSQVRGIRKPAAIAQGYVSRVVGLTLLAKGIKVALGGRCLVMTSEGEMAEAEVVGFDGSASFLMPLRSLSSLNPGAKVIPIASSVEVLVGDKLLGRVVDGTGQPLDGLGAISGAERIHFYPPAINPLDRVPISEPLDVGVRSINASLTIGCGQRVGLFAGSGVGKSVLLGMITRFTEADVVVVGLIGERGREVREFVESNLGVEGMAKTVVVAAPADETPVMRLRAGMYSARLAEHFRDQGKKTLLLFDSLTRYAQAQREIALATGEPPASKGYPPSVFAKLPQLVERAGNGLGNGGSITAIYTVLTEGDDLSDPVADSARAILDGHIVLSRDIAGEGIYPAVDIPASISRSMTAVVTPEHLAWSTKVKQYCSRYEQSKDLISVGAYTAGIDLLTDMAIAKQPEVTAYLTQGLNEQASFADSVQALHRVAEEVLPNLDIEMDPNAGLSQDENHANIVTGQILPV